jgi:hypothetical protein
MRTAADLFINPYTTFKKWLAKVRLKYALVSPEDTNPANVGRPTV